MDAALAGIGNSCSSFSAYMTPCLLCRHQLPRGCCKASFEYVSTFMHEGRQVMAECCQSLARSYRAHGDKRTRRVLVQSTQA